MKKQILLCVALGSVNLSIYPAKVLIRNQTDQPVFAQINNQKRSLRFWEDQKFLQEIAIGGGELSEASGAALFLFPTLEPATAIHRSVAGYPNFIKISPHNHQVLGTALIRSRKEEGGFLGRPIIKITFIRIIGHKTITGTIDELQKQVDALANKYGNIKLHDLAFTIRFVDELSFDYPNFMLGKKGKELKKRLEESDKTAQYSIEIPIVEKFTYDLGKNKIGIGQRRIVELQSWGNAVLKSKF